MIDSRIRPDRKIGPERECAEMSSIWKYKYFVDVIESKSFTKAGNMNFVSQTAISQNISSLEKMAGGKLVNRGKGEITPTELGRIVYRSAKKMLEIENRMMEEIEQLRGREITYIGIDSAINKKMWMTYEQIYDPFFLRVGEKMECYKIDSKIGARMMKKHELDIFIGYDDNELLGEPGIENQYLTSSRLGVYVGKNTSIPYGPLRLEDLRGHRCYVAPHYSCSVQKEACRRLEGICDFIEVRNVETMKMKVEFNNAFAFVDSRYFQGNDGEIRSLEDFEKDCGLRMYYPSNCDKKNVFKFMKMMKEKMKE